MLRRILILIAAVAVPLSLIAVSALPARADETPPTLSPVQGPRGTSVTASATDWPGCSSMSVSGWGRTLGTATINSAGAFSLSFTVPSDAALGATQLQFSPTCTHSTYIPFVTFTVTQGTPSPPPGCTYTPTVTFSPGSGPVGTTFTIAGSGWVPGGTVTSTLPYGSPGWFTGYQTPTVDASGGFSYKETVGTGPHGPTPLGTYTITYVEKYGGCSLSFHQAFTVTASPPPPPPPSCIRPHPSTAKTDYPWGGYGLYPDCGTHVTSVIATWRVPEVKCTNNGGQTRVAVWVGMWGTVHNSWLPQIGTDSECSPYFKYTYTAVYQLPTDDNGWLTILSGLQYLTLGPPQTVPFFSVHAGDLITASVTYEGPTLLGQRTFTISIKNHTTGQEFSRGLTTPIAASLDQVAGGGGAMVEIAKDGLAEFNSKEGHRLDITGLHVTFDANPAHWTAISYRPALNGHYLIGISNLTSADSFFVTWKRTK